MNDDLCQQLDDYLLDELSDEQREQFAQHLRECESCRSISQQQAVIEEQLNSSARAIPVPAGLEIRVKQHIQRERRRHVTLSALCVASAAGLLFSIWYFSSEAARQTDPVGPPSIAEQRQDQPPDIIPQDDPSLEENAVHDPEPTVQISFSDNVLAVPVESGDPTITLIQVYPVAKTQRESQ